MSRTDPSPSESGGSFQLTPRRILGLLVAVVAIAFILQNRDTVSTSLFVFEFRAPMWVTLLIVFLAGAAAGWLLQRRRKS